MILQSWSLVIFGYNEETTLPVVAEQALALKRHFGDPPFEIIIVDDGSRDRTAEIASRLAAAHPEIRIVTHAENRGIGEALRSGYAAARFENVCAVPADGQFSLTEMYPFGIIQENEIISFVRTINTSYTWPRKFLSWFNRALNKFLFGVSFRDVNWIKIYKTKAVQGLTLELRSLLVESEICLKLVKRGFTVREAPSTYLTRTAGRSKALSRKIVGGALKEILRLAGAMRRDKA